MRLRRVRLEQTYVAFLFQTTVPLARVKYTVVSSEDRQKQAGRLKQL